MAIDQQTIIELEKRLMAEIDTLREEKKSLAEELKTVKLALEESIANETSTRVEELSAAKTAIMGEISSTQQSTQQLNSKLDQAHARIGAVDEKAQSALNQGESSAHAVNNIHNKTDNTHAFNRLKDYLIANNGNDLGFGDH